MDSYQISSLDKKTYQKLQKDKSPWFCNDCVKNQLLFPVTGKH